MLADFNLYILADQMRFLVFVESEGLLVYELKVNIFSSL